MPPFEDILGYVFRKKVAMAVRLSAAQYVKADHHPSIQQEISQRKWTGEGPYAELLTQLPFIPVVWLCSIEGSKLKIRSEMDIANQHDAIWYMDSIVDIWLKTPMLTFNRAFPDEINVFKPALCSVDVLREHRRFAAIHDLADEFDGAFLAGVEPHGHTEAAELIAEARGG